MNENFETVAEALNLAEDDVALLARNSFTGSFLPDEEKARPCEKVDAALAGEAVTGC